MPLRVKRSITVKAIVTEELKAKLAGELQSALGQIEAELARLDAVERGGNAAERGGAATPAGGPSPERAKRAAQREQLIDRMRELAKLELGTEIVQGTVEGEAEVRLGDDWARVFASEVVLRDGRVVAIRE